MKKKLMLITLREKICDMYKEELLSVFDDYIEIYTYSFENRNKETFNRLLLKNMDLIIVTSNDVYSLIRNYLDNDIPLLYLHFTFTRDKINLLKLYPRDTNAYIGFRSYSASFQTVSLLYELGLNNLNIKVYNPSDTDVNIKDTDVCIVSNESNIFPPETKNVVSIGQRKLSFSTIMDIATNLSIIDDHLENIIYSYCDIIAIHDNCLNYFYDKSSNVNIQLQAIINCIDDSFVLLSNNYVILDHNMQVLSLLNIKKAIKKFNLKDIPEFENIYKTIKTYDKIKDMLVDIESLNKKVLVSKEKIKDKDNSVEIYILIIKDITNIINLENVLRKQLFKKGHVAKYTFDGIKGNSIAIRNCIAKAKKISNIDKPTLIVGESGTGKELFAQSIHNNSTRKKFPFIAINCATLPTTLLESELFGYEEGSFTGAKKGGKIGLFEAAHRGTLFLDEIGEMSLETQAKLLRVLEEKEIMRIGSNEIISVDVKIITATNRNLKLLVDKGEFRLDLFFRLNTMMIKIPPLRERVGDIEVLSRELLEHNKSGYKVISPDVLSFMLSCPWEGNVRELKNCIEYMASISDDIIEKKHFPEYMLENYAHSKELTIIESTHIDDNSTGFHEYKATIKIMETLLEHNMGRRNIIELLHSQNINISEYKLRSILDDLKSKGYISFGKGRAGAFITTAGRNALLNESIF